MKYLYNNEPNFTVVLPVGCNASCDFCFWHKRNPGFDYFGNLQSQINKLPKEFKQVSISGGEPTMLGIESFRYLLGILSERFDKIVLNTNGYKLLEFLSDNYIRETINYINLSRHGISDEYNQLVFKSKTVPSTQDIIEINKLKQVRLNMVFENDVDDISDWIKFAEYTESNGISFRRLASIGVKPISKLENRLDRDNTFIEIFKSKCDVCYGANYKKNNLDITIRYSVDEPMDYMSKNTIYEAISDGEGFIHYKWNNNKNTRLNFNVKYRRNILELILTKLYYKLYKEVI